jgi:HlyD family secretion protein
MKKHWRAVLIAGLLVVAGVVALVFVLGGSARRQSQSLQTYTVARGTLTASIGATGTIQARQQASMAFSISGRVGTVHVHLGDPINAGQVLIEMDPAYYPQQVISAQANLISAQKTLDDLKISQTALAQAELDLANAKKALDDAKANYNNTVQKFNSGWVQESWNRVNQAYSNYMIYRFTNNGSPAAVQELQRRYQVYLNALKDLEKAEQYQNMGVGSSASGTEEAKSEIAISKGQLDLAQSQYDDALAAYNRLKDGVPGQDLQAAQARVDAVQSILDQVRIKAPFSGTILAVNVVQGDMVNPGTAVLVIADLSELHVDVPIAEVDYKRLAAGQSTQLVLDAVHGTIYNGKVTQIGLNASTSGGSVSYPIRVVVSDADKRVLPGMTVSVQIEVSRLDNVLLVPNQAVQNVNGSLVVYVLQNGIQKPVTIVLGASNGTTSQVLKGDIKEGDVILLNPSTSIFNRGSTSGGGGGGGGAPGLFGGG